MYARKVQGNELTFGVSGLLYKANLLMYDHQSESLWSQAIKKAVTGPMTGTPLEVLPSTLTSWKKWKARHPNTMVLSTETGYNRDYSRDPYESYYQSREGVFSFLRAKPGQEQKELIVGVELHGMAKGYRLSSLRQAGSLLDRIGGTDLSLTYEPGSGEVAIRDASGRAIPYIVLYRFVWEQLHPDTPMHPNGKPR